MDLLDSDLHLVLILTIKHMKTIQIHAHQLLATRWSQNKKDLDLNQVVTTRNMSIIKIQMELMSKMEVVLLLFFLSQELILFQILVMVNILLIQ